jgi:hypothetical protein
MTERYKPHQKELRRAKNAVRGAFNKPKASYLELTNHYGRAKLSPPDLILGGFSQLTPENAEQFLGWLKGFPSKTVQIYPHKPVQTPPELKLQPVTIALPLIVRLNWLSTLLEDSRTDLEQFVALTDRFEQVFLAADYESAHSILDEVQGKFGFSVWLIETKIALLQRWKGLDAQKEYARGIGTLSRGRVAGVTAFWVSQRNEESTVFSRFQLRLEQRIEEWKVGEALKDAYAIILGLETFGTLTDARASSALGSLASISLADAYTATVSSLETILGNENWASQRDFLKAIVSRLPRTDVRIKNIAALLSCDLTGLPSARTDLLDQLYSGQNTEVTTAVQTPDAPLLWDYAIAKAENSSQMPWVGRSPANDLYDLVDAAIVRSDGFESRVEQGNKLLINLKHLPIASAVKGLLVVQDPRYPVGLPSSAVQFYINSRALHPWHSYVLPQVFALAICRTCFPQSPAAQLIALCLEGKLPADQLRSVSIREFAARQYLAESMPESALRYLQVESTTKSDEFARRRLAPLQVIAHLRLQRLDHSISAAAWACSIDPDIVTLVPLRDLVDDARTSLTKVDPLSLSVIYDLYLERFDDADVFQLLQFAYEDYVLKCGVERPSELVGRQNANDTSKLIYFLKHIAVPEVMDVSFWLFKTSRETLTERIAVCSTLIELDPIEESDYRDEIKEITRLLSIQDGLDDVDRSRVFVDLPKLQRWAENELREGFERYKALHRSGARTEGAGDFDKTLKDFAAGKATVDKFLNYPDDEQGQLLLEIYKAIADKYVHDPDFGLDAYLSMRIRHGSLAGHIRGPLEEQGLLAVRDHGTNLYRMLRSPAVDDQWTYHHDWSAVRWCVESFSRNFDALIDGLVKAKLQIKRDDKPEGLFVFDPAPLIIYYLRSNIDEGSTFLEFLGKVVDALNIYLSISLQNVSRFIMQDFGDAIGRSVDQFRAAIDENLTPQLSAELQTLIGQASPELQASIARVASWFALDAENERRTLRTMSQIVDIAIQATENAHRGFEPEYTLDIAVLEHMLRRSIEIPVAVITQFETFPKNGKDIGLDDIRSDLLSRFPKIFKGLIYYNSRETDWEMMVDRFLDEIGGPAE